MGEVIQQLIECGHEYDDIIDKYTLDQLWLFFEKSLLIRRKLEYELGVIIAHCMTLPLGGESAVKGFENFITSFLPDNLKKLRTQATKSGRVPKGISSKNKVMANPSVDVGQSFAQAFAFMELPTKPSPK